MNLSPARIGLLVAPATPVWTGTVGSYTGYTLTVSTVSGSFADLRNVTLYAAAGNAVRVRSTATNTLYLAENPAEFTAGDALTLYNWHWPWPRYQRLTEDGTVYKDYDIGFPTPWERILPPTPVVTAGGAGAVWTPAAMSVSCTASGSYGNLTGATPLTYAWDAGTGGTITGSGAAVTAAWSTAGFRHLACTVTDAYSSPAYRYLPVWVGGTPDALVSCQARWSLERGGWDISLAGYTAYTWGQPAAVVDLDTYEVLFFGYLIPESAQQTVDAVAYRYRLLNALAFSRYLHAYPFLVKDLESGDPTSWEQIPDLTLARALWYLLHWHSTVPEVANITLTAGRSIAGQEFRAGDLVSQVRALAQSAFYALRDTGDGSMTVGTHPLYLDGTAWAALGSYDLTSATLHREQLTWEPPDPRISEARLGGVYRVPGGDYEPAIVRAPTAPEAFGSPTELNNLAPDDQAELEEWAGRYIALENAVTRYTVQPRVSILPISSAVTLPGSVKIAVEEISLDFDGDALAWRETVSGRAYGTTASAALVPVPDAPTLPATPTPPPTAPLPPLPPVENSWSDGSRLVMLFENDADSTPRVYVTANATDTTPTWADATGNLSTLLTVAPLQIAFASGGTNRYAAYVAGRDEHLYYTPNLYASPVVWSDLTSLLPSGWEFNYEENYGVFSVWPCPLANGDVLVPCVNLDRDYGGEQVLWATVWRDGVLRVGPFWVCDQNFAATRDFHWGWDGESVFAGSIVNQVDSPLPKYLHHVTIPLSLATIRATFPADGNNNHYSWTAQWDYRMGVTPPSGTTSIHWPSWKTGDGNTNYTGVVQLTAASIARGPVLTVGGFDAVLAETTRPGLTAAWTRVWNGKHAGMFPQLAPGYMAVRKSTRDNPSVFYVTRNSWSTYETLTGLGTLYSGYVDISVGFWPGQIENATDPKLMVMRSNKATSGASLVVAAYNLTTSAWRNLTGDWNSKFGTSVFKRDDITLTLGAFSFFFGEEE